MTYYVMDSKNEGVMIMNRPSIPGDPEFDYGKKIDSSIPVIEFHMDKDSQGEIFDYILTTLPGITISAKFKEALDKAGIDNIDYYPARIINEVTGEVHENIYVANIIGSIACMDLDNSEYDTFSGAPDKIDEIEELKLDETKIRGQKIFRMKELDEIIIVDKKTKSVIEKANITNVIFREADGYSTD